MKRFSVPLLALLLFLGIAAPARAADPGRWVETGFSKISLVYYQGVTADPAGDLFFDGFTVGLYRTTGALGQQASVDDVIPAGVAQREGYNHVGDITWDAAEGGRVLLPLECYAFGIGNFCGTGSFGVADPQTLQWRYYVKLDPADIKKAMWAEVSPDGSLVWTSAGNDLLAYRTADITLANAAPNGPVIHPVRRLIGAVPPSGVTGAAFYGGRLFLAGQDAGPFQVWSVDLSTGERRLEIERNISGESEGLAVFDGLGGVLHWQIGFISFTGPPTYGQGHNALVHFVPANHPPDCSGATADPSRLWPPNHKIRLVRIGGVTDPDGDNVSIEVTGVTQDEETGKVAAGSAPDWLPGPAPGQVWLRAERAGAGDGRVYFVAFTATDPQGASCTGAVAVTVPHDAGR